MRPILTLAIASALAAPAMPAAAAVVLFNGSRENVDAPGPAAARCGTRATTNVRNIPPTATSSGVSNLGTFTPTLSHCIQLPLSAAVPTPFDLGEFSFDFGGGNVLFGTYSGLLTFLSPGVYAVAQTHLVSGGTGIFANASGNFGSGGTFSFIGGRPTVSQRFAGALQLPAIPEPATWGMLILGFGAVGGAMRGHARKRRRRGADAVLT
ncbi:PEPxxWA-CTERM sorting domain-containing protein [Qipengyuania sediminis]|uniref:PEPxxWA-CTERM sorting domain-containing protein n=1 Tax=Qipengyuania sediminis TaxID=1532023 RepID=UPI001F107818|nr:PEPxxWA-CTERM sorting domain-containing protein [Qipengyuania sediminis]